MKNKKQNHKEKDLGVILENVDSKIDLVLEGHKVLDTKIDKVDRRVADLKTEMNYKLDIHTEMIGKLSVDMAIVKEDVEFIKSSMKKKIDVDEFAALEKRVLLLEKRR